MEPGSYVLGTDGNVYFVPDCGPVDTITDASATTPPSYTSGYGEVDGTTGDDVIDASYVDADGDQIDDGSGGGDTLYGGDGNDTLEGAAMPTSYMVKVGTTAIRLLAARVATASLQVKTMASFLRPRVIP